MIRIAMVGWIPTVIATVVLIMTYHYGNRYRNDDGNRDGNDIGTAWIASGALVASLASGSSGSRRS